MSITSESFVRFMQALLEDRPSELRRGQHLFNLIYNYNPKLGQAIVATNLDPFHVDKNIGPCLEFVVKNWSIYED